MPGDMNPPPAAFFAARFALPLNFSLPSKRLVRMERESKN
jgi:hypothetical protein